MIKRENDENKALRYEEDNNFSVLSRGEMEEK